MSLELERKSIALDMKNLTKFLYSYVYRTLPLAKIRELRAKVRKIPDLLLNLSRYNDSPEETLTRALKFGQSWRQFMVENNLNIQESFIAVENFNELSPYLSHFFFFSEAVILQSNQNQIEE